jgi:hypothetical protein
MRPIAQHGTQVKRYSERSEVAIADYYEVAVRRQGSWVGYPQFDPMVGSHIEVFGAHGVFKPIPIIGMENDVRNSHWNSIADPASTTLLINGRPSRRTRRPS